VNYGSILGILNFDIIDLNLADIIYLDEDSKVELCLIYETISNEASFSQ
jgi:hypothetical protein